MQGRADKFMIFNTRNRSNEAMQALKRHEQPYQVSFIGDKQAAGFVINEKPEVKSKTTFNFNFISKSKSKSNLGIEFNFQFFIDVYNSMEEAVQAIQQFNRGSMNVLFNPLILVCADMKEQTVSKAFFEGLNEESTFQVYNYNYEDDETTFNAGLSI